MADLGLTVVKDIIKTGMAIKEAVDTVRQNTEECQKVQVLVARNIAILSWLQDMGLTIHPAMRDALTGLNESLDCAFKLVTECQKKKAMRRFLTASDMAKQLDRVHIDILQNMQLVNLATNASMMQVTIEFTRTTIIQHDAALPPSTQPLQLLSGAELWTYVKQTYNRRNQPEEDFVRAERKIILQEKIRIALIVQKSAKDFLSDCIRSAAVTGDEKGQGQVQAVVVGDMHPIKLMMWRKAVSEHLMHVSAAPCKPANRWPSGRGSGFRARIAKWIWPRARGSASLPLPPSPLRVEDGMDAPEHGSHPVSGAAIPAALLPQLHLPSTTSDDDLLLATTETPQIMQPEPAAARSPVVRRRRHTFNMSRVHRSSRLTSTRHHPPPGMLPRKQPSLWGAHALPLLMSCAFCTLALVLLLTCAWALH